MNNYAKIALRDIDYYLCSDSDTVEMYILGRFLASDVGCNRLWYRGWALFDSGCTKCGGNITFLEKKDGYVILSDQVSEEPDGGPYFSIEQREFVKLLDEWESICKQNPKPQEILITYDGKNFTFACK